MMIFSSFKKGLDQKKNKNKNQNKNKKNRELVISLRAVCRPLISFELNSLDALWRFRLL